jgi:hypothetical protein
MSEFHPGDRVKHVHCEDMSEEWRQEIFTVTLAEKRSYGHVLVLKERPNADGHDYDLGWHSYQFELVDDFVVSHTDWV